MDKDLRQLASASSHTVLWLVLINNLLSHGAGYRDTDLLTYCGWYDFDNCPTVFDVYWNCLETEFHCAYGKQYHCARHYTYRSRIIHGCAESKQCFIGEAPYLNFINTGRPTNELRVICAECHDKEHFNDIIRNSSTYSECKRKTICDPLFGIECNPADENSLDIYRRNRECRCNTFENYMFSQNPKGVICTSDQFLASTCYKVHPCSNGMERLQNATCVRKCIKGHRTRYSDECIEEPGVTSSHIIRSHTTQSTTPAETTISTGFTSVPQSSIVTTKNSQNLTNKNTSGVTAENSEGVTFKINPLATTEGTPDVKIEKSLGVTTFTKLGETTEISAGAKMKENQVATSEDTPVLTSNMPESSNYKATRVKVGVIAGITILTAIAVTVLLKWQWKRLRLRCYETFWSEADTPHSRRHSLDPEAPVDEIRPFPNTEESLNQKELESLEIELVNDKGNGYRVLTKQRDSGRNSLYSEAQVLELQPLQNMEEGQCETEGSRSFEMGSDECEELQFLPKMEEGQCQKEALVFYGSGSDECDGRRPYRHGLNPDGQVEEFQQMRNMDKDRYQKEESDCL